MGPFDDVFEPTAKEKRNVRNLKLADQNALTMHSAIESIIEVMKDSGFEQEALDLAKPYVEYVAQKQQLTLNQALILSLMMNRFYDDSTNIDDLARFLNCRAFTLLNAQNDIDELVKRHFLRCSHAKMPTYRIPHEVLKAVRDDCRYEWQCASDLKPMELFGKIMDIFDERLAKELTLQETCDEIDHLVNHNLQLEFCRTLKSLAFETKEQMLLVLYCHQLVNEHEDGVSDYDLKKMLGSHDFSIVKEELSCSFHPLIASGMLEHACDSGFLEPDEFKLSRHAKDHLLKELNLVTSGDKTLRDITHHRDIIEKSLFYNEAVTRQINRLRELLSEEKYKEIRDRLLNRGFRCGFACLFYGAPGTGKTETALQLARQTGRDIMTVNLSQIKNMYVGESEKNVKAIFDKYRALAKDLPKAPILLFNEADGIFSRRQKNVRHSVDQMENTLQNIILQEMESFDGILIATTNLTSNLDKAFERRFLYKIDFEAPDDQSRKGIWQAMIPDIASEDAKTLAKRYSLSGGQIENVARKLMVESLLYGKTASLDVIDTLCREEKTYNGKNKQIGF